MPDLTLFEKIHQGTIPAKILAREDLCFAIQDIDPKAPFHVLIIPVKPIASLAEVGPEDGEILLACLAMAKALADANGMADGWRLVANVGVNGGQSVPHLHFHLLGGRRLGWPPG